MEKLATVNSAKVATQSDVEPEEINAGLTPLQTIQNLMLFRAASMMGTQLEWFQLE